MTEKKWERLEPTFSLEDERLASLKQIVPEAFTDGKVDFEQLRALLGEAVEDESAEHFGLNWTGKREARRLAGMPSKGTLVPVPGKGLNEDTTENIFIEGDNLEVLKLLHKSYRGKIKMIYIDPPYNTGNDFIYKDDYRMPLESYLQRSGQKSDMGELLTSNPKSGGRFHSDWLNMMYPRLRVAWDLLTTDGVIFVSIGDDEVNHLTCILDEMYGRENLAGIFSWKSRAKPTNAGDARFRPQRVAEYVLAYAKLGGDKHLFNVVSAKERTYPHFDKERQANYRTTTILTSNRGMFRRETMRFEIAGFSPDEEQRWKAGFDVIKEYFDEGRLGFNEDGTPFLKHFEGNEEEALYPLYTFIEPDLSGTAELGKSELNRLLGRNHGIDTVKPSICKYLVASTTGDQDYVLDFFTGSGTTAQAVNGECGEQ
ncbi:MAG: site-specific DNA-methyltransferase [Pyrinomonadaceae bacterium]